MVYDICLNVAGVMILLIIIYSSGAQRTKMTEQNRRFRLFAVVTVLALVFETLADIFIGYKEMIPVILNAWLQLLGFATEAWMAYCYAAYMESFVVPEKRNKVFAALNRVILAVYYLFHLVNLHTGHLFYFDEQKVYHRGSVYVLVYLIPFYFLLYGTVVMFRRRRDVERRQFYATMSLLPFLLSGMIVQYSILPNHLILFFMVTLSEMIIFFNLETPDYKKLTDTMKQLEISRSEAEAANLAKSSFLAQMSHEIRTPINAVLGMNEMILRESKDEAISEYAANAYSAGKALLAVINDILDISKIEAGKLEIVEMEYDIESLVNDCYHMTADRAEKKHLRFVCRVEETLPAKLYGDMFHLRQIVVNFLTNAIKYTDEGSVELSFSGERDGDKLLLRASVRDTGIGLTEESREQLFTSFQRFDLARNQSVEGTGLGLSICKQLAELMSGSVGVESVYGEGSTFWCVIPQRIMSDVPVGRVALDQPAKVMEPGGGKCFTAETAHILVVDDVEMNLLVFSSLLKGHNLQIDEALSGRQCLDMVQKRKYDVIFMDHMMPEMDGLETLATMKAMEHENHDTPVVMLTANAISGEKEKYLAMGFAAYLTKPIQSDKLEEVLLAYLPKEKIVWKEVAAEKEKLPEIGEPLETEKPLGEHAAVEAALFDVTLGLTYAGGNEEAYHAILSNYVDRGPEKLARIRQLYERGAWKDYVTEVHALKSTSLTIGSRLLSEAAAELEQAGKGGDYDTIRQNQDHMLELYNQVLDVGREALKLLGSSAADSAAAPDDGQKVMEEIAGEQLQEYVRRILEAADAFDSDTIVALCGELSQYRFQGEDLGAKFKPVKEAAEDFECELAGERAREVMAEMSQ